MQWEALTDETEETHTKLNRFQNDQPAQFQGDKAAEGHGFHAMHARNTAESLDFSFFVGNVLAHHRIVLAKLKLAWLVFFVFGGGVEMPGSSGRNQFDFISSGLSHDRNP